MSKSKWSMFVVHAYPVEVVKTIYHISVQVQRLNIFHIISFRLVAEIRIQIHALHLQSTHTQAPSQQRLLFLVDCFIVCCLVYFGFANHQLSASYLIRCTVGAPKHSQHTHTHTYTHYENITKSCPWTKTKPYLSNKQRIPFAVARAKTESTHTEIK